MYAFSFPRDQVELEEMRAPLVEKLRTVEQEKEQLQRVSQKMHINNKYTMYMYMYVHVRLMYTYMYMYICVNTL